MFSHLLISPYFFNLCSKTGSFAFVKTIALWSILIGTVCLPLHADVYFSDDMEGASSRVLATTSTDAKATYTLVHDITSPFTPVFGSIPTSGFLNDQSTEVCPTLGQSFVTSPDAWVKVEYDIHLTSGDWWQWKNFIYSVGGEGGQIIIAIVAPTQQGFSVSARTAPGERPIGFVPNISCVEGRWYHVELLFSPPSGPPDQHKFSLTVKDQDGKTGSIENLLYLYDTSSPVGMLTFNGNGTDVTKTAAIHLDNVRVSGAKNLSMSYYPSKDTIKAEVSVNGLEKDKITGIKLILKSKEGNKEVATTKMPPLQGTTTTKEWKIPSLPAGKYELAVEFEGVSVKPVSEDFVRNIMAWEHTSLGKSDVVVPPFKPITVSGKNLEVIFRKFSLDDLGLWEQVVSKGRPLLKEPMRLEIKAGGKSYIAKGCDLSFRQSGSTKVITESTWTAGHIKGTTESEWDYDGLMKWNLKIDPSKTPIDSITLVIPMDSSLMPLFHTCTDGIRINYAGAIPKGEGKVWDGIKVPRNSIIGSYVPYIWAGAEERGLAVFGENDRGWVTNLQIACQELVRKGDTLELRLNLIATPITLTQKRNISIGFQATPIKPMPEGWRTWTTSSGRLPGNLNTDITFMGTCFTWGALTPCADIYPRNEDFSIYAKLAERRKGASIDQEFIDKWLAGYPLNDPLADKAAYLPHIRWSFQSINADTQKVLVYTNGRGIRFNTPEGQTFLDEWDREAFPPRSCTQVYYDMDPVESFRDYAMTYYKKMLESFVDYIYWDDVFLQSNFDTVLTDAYELPDGRIQPSSGIYNMRELIRRTAVLDYELHKDAFNQAHMSNTAIAPILAFSGTQYTWEDHMGDADFQDRFSREYIRAESIGRQTGNVPFALTLIKGAIDDPKNKWVLRTNAGVALTHEIKPGTAYLYPAYWSNYVRLLEFGYGKSSVKVANYWDENYPVKIEGSETSSLVVSKPGSAFVTICDYGNGGDIKVSFEPEAMGLGSKYTVKDTESGEFLPVNKDGSISFALKKHDFKMLKLETEITTGS